MKKISKGQKIIAGFGIIVLVAFMVAAWPLNLFWGNSIQDKGTGEIAQEYSLSENDYITQNFVAQDKKLAGVEIYLTDVGYEQDGSLELIIGEQGGNELVRKEVPLESLDKDSFNYIRTDCKVNSGSGYYVQIGLSSDRNIKFGTEEQGENAESSTEFFYDGTQEETVLCINYFYQSDFNKIQTLMFWMVCVLLGITIFYITFFDGWKKFGKKITDKRTLWQIWVVLALIAAFNFGAYFSSAVEVERTAVHTVKVVLICGITLLFLWYLLRQTKKEQTGTWNIKKVITEKKEPVILLLLAMAVRLPMYGTLQKWDAGEYYRSLGRACASYEFSLKSFLDNFRLCTHSNLGFSFLMGIGEFFSPQTGRGIFVVNMIFTLLAVYAIYDLLKNYWLKCDRKTAAVLAFLVSCTPIFLGTFAYVNVDYLLAVLFIYIIYAEYRKWYVLLGFCAVLLSQTKETGVVVVVGYFGFQILIRFLRTKRGIRERIAACFQYTGTWAAFFAGAVYACMVIRLGSISGWVQSKRATSTMAWSSSGINCFGIQPKYICYKLEQYFIMNFAWIMTIALLVALIFLLVRKKKSDVLRKMMGIIGAMLAFVAFGLLYVTYTLERYNIMFALALTLITVCVVYEAAVQMKWKKTGVVVRAVTVLLLLVQSFWCIDPVSEAVFGTADIGNGHKMLFSSLGFDYYGDGLVCNYQYSWLDKAFDKMLRQVNYDEDMQVIMTRKGSVATHLNGNGSAYPITWDAVHGKRVFNDENATIRSLSIESLLGMLPYKEEDCVVSDKMSDRAMLYFIPYYEDNREENVNLLSKYFYLPEEEQVSAYGGTIDYYNMIKKDSYGVASLGEYLDALKNEQTGSEFSEESCKEMVVDAIEKQQWGQMRINDRLDWDRLSQGSIMELEDTERSRVQENDVIDLDIYAYDEDGKEIGIDYLGNASGHIYENIVVQDGKLLDGIVDALVDTQIGDTVEVACKIPEDYMMAGDNAGHVITFKLTPVEIIGKWHSDFSDYTAQECDSAYNNAEWSIWQNVSQSVEKEILLNTVDVADDSDSELLQRHIAAAREAYKAYFNTVGISESCFINDYLQCTEEEYDKLIELVARADIRKDFVDQALYDYKSAWDYVERLYNLGTGEEPNEQDEKVQTAKLDMTKAVVFGNMTWEQVYQTVYDEYTMMFDKMDDEEFVNEMYRVVFGQSGENNRFYEQILEEGGTRNDIVSKMLQEKEEQD